MDLQPVSSCNDRNCIPHIQDRKPKDIKARQKQEKKLKKLEKQQKKRLASQARHQKKEAKLYGK